MDHARLYATADELLAELGKVNDGPAGANYARATIVTDAASWIVESVVGAVGVVAHLIGPTDPPAGAHLAALALGVDLWARPSAPGGYFQLADYAARLAADPAASVLALLTPYRETWAIA